MMVMTGVPGPGYKNYKYVVNDNQEILLMMVMPIDVPGARYKKVVNDIQ